MIGNWWDFVSLFCCYHRCHSTARSRPLATRHILVVMARPRVPVVPFRATSITQSLEGRLKSSARRCGLATGPAPSNDAGGRPQRRHSQRSPTKNWEPWEQRRTIDKPNAVLAGPHSDRPEYESPGVDFCRFTVHLTPPAWSPTIGYKQPTISRTTALNYELIGIVLNNAYRHARTSWKLLDSGRIQGRPLTSLGLIGSCD